MNQTQPIYPVSTMLLLTALIALSHAKVHLYRRKKTMSYDEFEDALDLLDACIIMLEQDMGSGR